MKHVFVKPCIKYKRLDRNALKWPVFSHGMEITHEQKYVKLVKRCSISQN